MADVVSPICQPNNYGARGFRIDPSLSKRAGKFRVGMVRTSAIGVVEIPFVLLCFSQKGALASVFAWEGHGSPQVVEGLLLLMIYAVLPQPDYLS